MKAVIKALVDTLPARYEKLEGGDPAQNDTKAWRARRDVSLRVWAPRRRRSARRVSARRNRQRSTKCHPLDWKVLRTGADA